LQKFENIHCEETTEDYEPNSTPCSQSSLSLCTVDKRFSTAGPRTSTGPRRFFSGPQNNLDIPSSN